MLTIVFYGVVAITLPPVPGGGRRNYCSRHLKTILMRRFLSLACLLMLLTLQGCAVAGGIFKAGVWVGILAVVLVVVVIGVIVSKSKK